VTETTMTIREMCETYNVTPRTLRFYEFKELLFPQRLGTHRMFTKRDRARLKLILRGKRFGFSLEDIRQLLNLYDIGDQQFTQLDQTCTIARARLADMIQQRAELGEAIADLETQLTWGEQMLEALSRKEAAE
jgi:DNA-binding transcriptional MerR regulator